MRPLRSAAPTIAVAPLAAHHSAAMFDDDKVVELTGTIKEMQWTNPHIWIQVIVNTNGQKAEWSLEGGSPNSLSRNGWRSTTFKFGDAVIVRANPMKDGSPGGSFIGAKFKDTGEDDRPMGVGSCWRFGVRRQPQFSDTPIGAANFYLMS